MAQLSADLDVLKEIPGYKAILKSVLKSQIQLLIEQLSEHTGEESVIMTASIHDGSLSHLGSGTGKGFLEGREEIKSQFLGYCLKTHHKQKTSEVRTPYQRTHLGPRKSLQPPIKHPKLHSMTVQSLSPGQSTKSFVETKVSSNSLISNNNALSLSQDSDVKSETQETQSVEASMSYNSSCISDDGQVVSVMSTADIPYSVQVTHTLTSSTSTVNNDQSNSNLESRESELGFDLVIVKTEVNTDETEDLEITGVEIGNISMSGWSHGQMGYSSEGNSSMMSGDQSVYNINSRLVDTQQTYSNRPTCPKCGRVFLGKTDLQRHLLVHSGEKPFPCTHCPQKFRRKHHLQTHILSKHKDAIDGNSFVYFKENTKLASFLEMLASIWNMI